MRKHCFDIQIDAYVRVWRSITASGKFESYIWIMPKAYAVDLRWCVVWLYLAQNRSSSDISTLLLLSERSVRRYISLFYRTGDVEPTSQRHGPQKLLGDFGQLTLLHIILSNPGIYLSEIKDQLTRLVGVEVSVSTICRTLKFMGCSRQAMCHVALQRSDQLRAKFMAQISVYDPAMFIWLDETGCDRRNVIRKYGYSIRGIPLCDQRLLLRGKRYNAIPILSLEGIHDLCSNGVWDDNQTRLSWSYFTLWLCINHQYHNIIVLRMLNKYDYNNIIIMPIASWFFNMRVSSRCSWLPHALFGTLHQRVIQIQPNSWAQTAADSTLIGHQLFLQGYEPLNLGLV